MRCCFMSGFHLGLEAEMPKDHKTSLLHATSDDGQGSGLPPRRPWMYYGIRRHPPELGEVEQCQAVSSLDSTFLDTGHAQTFPSKSVQHKGFPNTELGQLTATSVRRTWKALPQMLTKGVQILAVLNCLRVYSSPCMFLLKSQTNILIHEKGSLSEKKKKRHFCKRVQISASFMESKNKKNVSWCWLRLLV